MYILKNALKNLGRNKGRNIIMGIIMICLLAVASVSISIDSTTRKIKESYKELYGAEVFVQPDFDKIMAQADNDSLLQFPEIAPSLYKELMKSEYLKETKVVHTWAVLSSNTDPVEQENQNTMNGSSSVMINGENGTTEMPELSLKAYSDMKYFKDFDEGKRTLIEGKMFENDNEVLISQAYAKKNKLKLGSQIKVNLPNDSNELELTVSGIFANQEQNNQSMMFTGFGDLNNELLVSEQTLLKANVSESIWSFSVYNFYLKNPELLNAFNEEAHQKGMSDLLNMTTDEATYNQMVKPIEGIAKTSMTFLWVFLGFGCGLIILLSILSVRERKYEVGVLRAIGMKKTLVVRTLLYESFATMIVCLLLGLSLGAFAAKPVSAMMLDNQKEQNQGISMVVSVGADAKEIETSDVIMTLDAIVKVSLVGIGVALLSTSVGIIYVLRYEPMEILVERN